MIKTEIISQEKDVLSGVVEVETRRPMTVAVLKCEMMILLCRSRQFNQSSPPCSE